MGALAKQIGIQVVVTVLSILIVLLILWAVSALQGKKPGGCGCGGGLPQPTGGQLATTDTFPQTAPNFFGGIMGV